MWNKRERIAARAALRQKHRGIMGECRRRRSPVLYPCQPGRGSNGSLTAERSVQITTMDPNRKSSQLFSREILYKLWYITITERKKARTAKNWSRRRCRFKSCRGHQVTAPWCRWLTRLPVTQEIAGSSPVGVAIRPLGSMIEYRFKKRALFMALYVNRQTGGLSLRRCGFKSRQSRQMLPSSKRQGCLSSKQKVRVQVSQEAPLWSLRLTGSGPHPFKVSMPVRIRQGSPSWARRLTGQDTWFSPRKCEFESHWVFQQLKSTHSKSFYPFKITKMLCKSCT